MWLAYLLLFIALSPGVLFTIPALGKKMGGKVVIAAMHAVLFVIVVKLLNVAQEGFAAVKTPYVPSARDMMGQSQAEVNAAAERMILIKNKIIPGGQAAVAIDALKNSLNSTINAMSSADELLQKEENAAAGSSVSSSSGGVAWWAGEETITAPVVEVGRPSPPATHVCPINQYLFENKCRSCTQGISRTTPAALEAAKVSVRSKCSRSSLAYKQAGPGPATVVATAPRSTNIDMPTLFG